MNTPTSRRQMMKLIAGGALAAVPAIRMIDNAAAGRTWCRIDPELRINGQLVHVYVDSEDGMLTDTTGPIKLVVKAPLASTVELVSVDNGFGRGYTVSTSLSSGYRNTSTYFDLAASIYVPSTGYHKLVITLQPVNPYNSSATSWPTWTNTSTTVATKVAYK